MACIKSKVMPPLRVKFACAKPTPSLRAGNCEFIFDPAERHYDWFVAYEDLPRDAGETLACPPAHTLLITAEPSSIKAYGRVFLRQFAWVLTSQEPWALSHPGAIRQQPGLLAFYEGAAEPAVAQKSSFSTVCSNKQQRHTLHHLRYTFTQKLKAAMPELEVYGHGVRPMAKKNEALDPYKYHLAVENHLAPHHLTEKLSDAFLGLCLPFYFGAPNAADYYPAESFIPVDLRDFDGTLKIIREAIDNGEYEKRLPAIREARRLVLEKWGTFPQLARLIEERHGKPCHADGWKTATVRDRHQVRKGSLDALFWHVWDTTARRLRALARNA